MTPSPFSLRAIAALMALGLCSAAHAQSSVQISGRIDLAARRVDNGPDTQNQLVREGARSSKLSIQANEDLGGGLSAGVVLEMQVRADTGTSASTFWERQSLVRLRGPFGELRLGRDFALQNSIGGDFDALNGKGVGNMMNMATPFNFSNTNTYTRVNNAVSYLTPNWQGVYAQLQLAPSEGTTGNRHVAAGLFYVQPGTEARATWGRTKVNSVGRVNALTGVSRAVAAEGEFDYAGLGLSHDFGPVRLLGSYLFWRSAQEVATGQRRFQRNLNLGAMVPVGAAGSVNLAWTGADRSGLGSDDQDGRQLAVQYVHKLSKRTLLYTSWARLSQSALAAADTASSGARYNVDGTTLLGRTGGGIDVGIVHAF